ncbi:uncharacterized protein LOC129947446 [Eupeodes corollae]|uniref:uncharacterized protein LOC129947446 n=1 Tax=Eupeodes corollae TaxID=290404 RepID=UPI002492FDA2|nr:uncharacterized protein LOC129947446 [Eupeodes corollae]
MESKDNRHKDKRSSMKHHKKNFHRKNNGSSQVEIIRSLIDVADSSDDRISGRPIYWSSKAIDSDIDNEQMHAADFELLTQMPNSVGGHFQFTSEKNWESEDMFLNKTQASEYFTLDLNLLNAGLQTIPFYKRLDFPSSWFGKSRLKAMNNAADIAEKQYQTVLDDLKRDSKGKINSVTARNSTVNKHNSGQPETVEKAVNDIDKELDDLLNLTTDKVSMVNIDVPPINEVQDPANGNNNVAEGQENREGIQQWLDDVLDE